MYYSIKEVSEKICLPPHVLRYYEKEGLLPSITRSESGIRRYTDADLEWLGLVLCLKNTGMSIKQIKSFVELSIEGDKTLELRCKLLSEHKKNVEIKMAEMAGHLEIVTHKLEYFKDQYDRYLKSKSQ